MADDNAPIDIETRIRGDETRVSVSRGKKELGTLIFNCETICWVPLIAENEPEDDPQLTWLMPWEQFAEAMQSVELGDIVPFDQSALVPPRRAAASQVSADTMPGSAMPDAREQLGLRRRFNTAEYALIRKGHPPDWDAKWGICFDPIRGELRMCRSWTGICIYLLKFSEDSLGAEIAESCVNRDPEQYEETDTRHDAEVASWLVDVFLLGREREFPSKSSTTSD